MLRTCDEVTKLRVSLQFKFICKSVLTTKLTYIWNTVIEKHVFATKCGLWNKKTKSFVTTHCLENISPKANSRSNQLMWGSIYVNFIK